MSPILELHGDGKSAPAVSFSSSLTSPIQTAHFRETWHSTTRRCGAAVPIPLTRPFSSGNQFVSEGGRAWRIYASRRAAGGSCPAGGFPAVQRGHVAILTKKTHAKNVHMTVVEHDRLLTTFDQKAIV